MLKMLSGRFVTGGIALISILLCTACSDSKPPSTSVSAPALQPFPVLPTSMANSVQISGEVADWLLEGDAGCFGILTDKRTNISVYAEANLCEPVNIVLGSVIKVDIVFDQDKQKEIGDAQNPSYTIVRFLR